MFANIVDSLIMLDDHTWASFIYPSIKHESIIIKNPMNEWERIHNKVMQIVLYYFQMNKEQESFSILWLSKLKELQTIIRSIESLVTNVFFDIH